MTGNTTLETATDYERPCPICGAETTIKKKRRSDWRQCTSCHWEITKEGPSKKSRESRLEERVEELERKVERLESEIGRESDK